MRSVWETQNKAYQTSSCWFIKEDFKLFLEGITDKRPWVREIRNSIQISKPSDWAGQKSSMRSERAEKNSKNILPEAMFICPNTKASPFKILRSTLTQLCWELRYMKCMTWDKRRRRWHNRLRYNVIFWEVKTLWVKYLKTLWGRTERKIMFSLILGYFNVHKR